MLPLSGAPTISVLFTPQEDVPVVTAPADIPENLIPDDLALAVYDETGAAYYLLTNDDGNIDAYGEVGIMYELSVVSDQIAAFDENNDATYIEMVVV